MSQTADQTVVKRVLIDLDRCIECGSCAAACYASHANMPVVGFARTGPALLPSSNWRLSRLSPLAASCRP